MTAIDQEEIEVTDMTVSIGVVVSDFYSRISDRLLSGALKVLKAHPKIQYEVVRVAGAWEVPVVIKTMVQSGRFQGMIAIGCVIRGETPHFDYLCQQSSAALMRISMDYTIPVGFGILTVENENQANDRSHSEIMERNKGAEAATAVVGAVYTVASVRQEF